MKIGIFGTGMVGVTIASKLVRLGHEVKMGSRTSQNEKAMAWVKGAGGQASQGTFAETAGFGELLFNCTHGAASLEALKAAGASNLKGKILIDLANPLDFSQGMPPSLTVCNTDSLGEQIQRAFPEVRVVKTLNTVNCNLMVNAAMLPGEHDLFICGNDPSAKATVKTYLTQWFGWSSILDLGDITNARATEMLLPIWIRLFGFFQSPNFNFKIVKN